jgi:hypothetical protein
LKSKPSFERPAGTGWAGKAAKHAAGSMTRRGALCRLGYAAAAIFGANFLVADGPKATATVVANPPCQFNQTSPCSTDGWLCGLQPNAAPCNPLSACPGCLQANGCPQGSAPSGSWKLCCQCLGNPNLGRMVTFTDCCGTPFDPTGSGPCGSSCPALLRVPKGCNGNHCNACIIADWCEPFAGKYICTNVTSGGKCTP